jgi:hypothetical protein
MSLQMVPALHTMTNAIDDVEISVTTERLDKSQILCIRLTPDLLLKKLNLLRSTSLITTFLTYP